MPKVFKIMLFWTLAAPAIVTFLRIIIDYLLGKNIELLSYSTVFIGLALAGLIFSGPLYYLVSKSKAK